MVKTILTTKLAGQNSKLELKDFHRDHAPAKAISKPAIAGVNPIFKFNFVKKKTLTQFFKRKFKILNSF